MIRGAASEGAAGLQASPTEKSRAKRMIRFFVHCLGRIPAARALAAPAASRRGALRSTLLTPPIMGGVGGRVNAPARRVKRHHGISVPEDLQRKLRRLSGTMNVSPIRRRAMQAYGEDRESASPRRSTMTRLRWSSRLYAETATCSWTCGELGWNDARDRLEEVDCEGVALPLRRVDILK